MSTTTPGHVLVTAPVEEPLSLVEAKDWLRVTHSAEDDRISAMIQTARELVESEYERAIVNQTWRLYLDSFPCEIQINRGPVQSITSIQYTDLEGATQTLSTSVYELLPGRDPAIIALAYYQIWPQVRYQYDAVRVTYLAGYGTSEQVPARLKQALLLMLSHWYEGREKAGVMPAAVDRLLLSIWNGSY